MPRAPAPGEVFPTRRVLCGHGDGALLETCPAHSGGAGSNPDTQPGAGGALGSSWAQPWPPPAEGLASATTLVASHRAASQRQAAANRSTASPVPPLPIPRAAR